MLCWCLEVPCLYNYEIDKTDYTKIIENIENNKKLTITSLVKQNRQNDFMEFLIVLSDKHYKKKYCFSKYSLYDNLLRNEFPGYINIINQEELKVNNNYIIKDAVIFKKLYIKLSKENLYIDSSKYEEYLLNSITNEFLRVISTLKPSSIKLKISNENNDEIDFDINTSISFQDIDIESEIKNKQLKNSNNTKEWLLTFTKDSKRIDLTCFLDITKFYYLPKYVEWTDLIHNRMNYSENKTKYVYEHTINNNIDIEFIEKMKLLNIECKYKKSKYENLKFEYEIDYYPL